jgi:hypothetical protein
MEELKEKLKNKGLTDSSIKLYFMHLKKLNGNETPDNLKMLNNPEDIMKLIENMKDTTKKSYLTSIVSILGCYPDVKKLQKLRGQYYILVNDIVEKIKETPTSELSKTQAENWINWDDVIKVYEEKKTNIMELIKGKKTITDNVYLKLLDFIVLSCYTLIAPRRNSDFMNMRVKYNVLESDSKEFNYLDLTNNNFIFNVFKTSKQYPETTINIPDDLMANIKLYLKYHPLFDKTIKKNELNIPFLVFPNKEEFKNGNTITRILNKIFKKNIGVSMLRHSYLTYKYGAVNEDKIEDAKNMGHSIETQGDYIKRM